MPATDSEAPPLPLWLLILIVGIIVGVSMAATQSNGPLSCRWVTRRSTIGREPFRSGDGAGRNSRWGSARHFFGGLIDKFGAGRIVVILRDGRRRPAIYFMYAATSTTELPHQAALSDGAIRRPAAPGRGTLPGVEPIGRLAPPPRSGLSAIGPR